MISKSGKTIGFEDSEVEALEFIKRDLNVKKDLEYQLLDLNHDGYISVDANIACWKKEARWAKQKKPQKRKVRRNDVIDDKYSKWLGTQPCAITGQIAIRGIGAYNMHCHHIHGRNGVRNDYLQVPLIGYVHSWGSKSYHSCAMSDFIKHHHLSTKNLIRCFENYAVNLRIKYANQRQEKICNRWDEDGY